VHEIVVAACKVSFRSLDLDDARPGIGQPAAAHRRGDRLFERDDKNAGKGEGHHYRLICGLVDFEIDQAIDPVAFGVAIDLLVLVFEYTANEIVCNADIYRAPLGRLARK
jgi:hypothetical protein